MSLTTPFFLYSALVQAHGIAAIISLWIHSRRIEVTFQSKRINVSKNTGFSLVEVMVAVAILAIVLGIGIPGFQSMFENSRVNRANDAFAAAVQLARSEAITRELPANGRIRLCERNAADNGCSGDQSWGDGLIVLEVNAAGNTVQVVRVWDAIQNATVTSGAAAFNFASDGTVDTAAGFVVSVGSDTTAYCMRLTGSVFQGACPP
ncbi:GspH/FimT family pseudopilin [Marinobacterium stanieri]|uniref:GspH/FimT family pseudopilin n=1 Tax=Marinobacterium stanieri TaxID=49186 RepID=UPI0002558F64|nr:GspH/FimT family pseudopilin [Marinobacterium stanieri]